MERYTSAGSSILSRPAAFGIAVNMVVAVVMVHARNGLFMNWQSKQAGEGYVWFRGGRTLHVQMEPRLSS